MRCEACRGIGWVIIPEGDSHLGFCKPCGACHGGISHCCDGLQAQPDNGQLTVQVNGPDSNTGGRASDVDQDHSCPPTGA